MDKDHRGVVIARENALNNGALLLGSLADEFAYEVSWGIADY
jgi:hypothetical protein